MLCKDVIVQHILDTLDACIWYVLRTEFSHKEEIWGQELIGSVLKSHWVDKWCIALCAW